MVTLALTMTALTHTEISPLIDKNKPLLNHQEKNRALARFWLELLAPAMAASTSPAVAIGEESSWLSLEVSAHCVNFEFGDKSVSSRKSIKPGVILASLRHLEKSIPAPSGQVFKRLRSWKAYGDFRIRATGIDFRAYLPPR
jgi:hypothetical protein